MTSKKDPGEGEMVIFRPFITLKNGKRLYAWQKGLKAFRLVVKSKRKKR
ncbi:MAG: hypothetical protein K8T25_21730 [Planctomycetia bacterium]|nr:hypothetical protein [Planctomycetia bacterium]